MPPWARPLSDWFNLLMTWQAVAALAAILVVEAGMLVWFSFEVVEQTFDSIESGQLYVDHSSYLEGWVWGFLTYFCLQFFLGRNLGGSNDKSPPGRLWLWAILCGVTAAGWALAVALVAQIAQMEPIGSQQFNYLMAENAAVSVISVLILPIAVWQVASLQPGPRLSVAKIALRLQPNLLLWMLNFALLQIGLNLIGEFSERLAVAWFSGRPAWGYLTMTLGYGFVQVSTVLFPVAACRSISTRIGAAEVFA